ncbi:MAG TPA: metallopeptidase family protein [Dehalococcoidia bacterium]|nr:metallopeptidase family protein [Dehalococcoidia bacterium]
MARMTVEEFEEVVLQALERLPEQFRDALHNLDIEVRWRPSLRERRRAGLHERGSLFGTYTGIPLTHRGQSYNMALPDKIIIYQETHERFCPTREDMVRQAEKTLLHEIGHYLGMSEQRLRDLGMG